MKRIVFFDTETDIKTGKVRDCGAIDSDGNRFHASSVSMLGSFLKSFPFIAGHNIFEHDMKHLAAINEVFQYAGIVDTLLMSPILFPNKPYHKLLKDDKLQAEERNNPLNDSMKSRDLFADEVTAFLGLDEGFKTIYSELLSGQQEYQGFFQYLSCVRSGNPAAIILSKFSRKLCIHSKVQDCCIQSPVETAYALAVISATESYSIIPKWVHHRFPKVESIIRTLRGCNCHQSDCVYCKEKLDIHMNLKRIFGYDEFRTYNGETLQANAVQAAADGSSLLAIFPTGGGKSLTFQLPALIAGEAEKSLTIVISPLQSLMKDQVDNLEKRGIVEAVTINGLQNPIERSSSVERALNGMASLLYVAPESLRSSTIEHIMMSRNISRIVIDEAHCFSAWGQDFRVDYLYIGEFIRRLSEKKGLSEPIPVSCFTATAKQKVVRDICDYFQRELGISLALFTTNATRTNLHYTVLYTEDDEKKYLTLRNLIEGHNCPTIVYASRTKTARRVAERLRKDGFLAEAFHGKMESHVKKKNQEAFLNDEVQVIVATSAFGMGVDKPNVKLVIHYDISSSLEDYVQEAGRAGRDPALEAECYVLYNEADLDKHFLLLNQTKLSISEIQQIWKAIKDLTKRRPHIQKSPLELARQAGWNDRIDDLDTRVKTAVCALEQAGYVRRGRNVPRVYADSLIPKSMLEASAQLRRSRRFSESDRITASRILNSLFSCRSTRGTRTEDAESRVDYLADTLEKSVSEIIRIVELLREERILTNDKDIKAYIEETDSRNKAVLTLKRYLALESFLVSNLPDQATYVNLKELNSLAESLNIGFTSVNAIKKLYTFWMMRGWLEKQLDNSTSRFLLVPKVTQEELQRIVLKRSELAAQVISCIYDEVENQKLPGDKTVYFSVLEVKESFENEEQLSVFTDRTASGEEVEDAISYMEKMGAVKLEGGFLVLYSMLDIERLELDNKVRYKEKDYTKLDVHYKQKIQQIHIVGEFANMMTSNYAEALEYVRDYFSMDYRAFLMKYFRGKRSGEINRNITPMRFEKVYGVLSEEQRLVLDDTESKTIVVAAGPGSGKTKVLVHKLASLMQLEDVKHEQLLMLTFSRGAATEFQRRLVDIIGNAAYFVDIKTFHSYCFDVIGRVGSLTDSNDVVKEATRQIREGLVENDRITKTVLVIDEAQDMNDKEYELIEVLMEHNDDLRVIAVGDDDQSIYGWRESSSRYMRQLIEKYEAKLYELTANYRSSRKIVDMANRFTRKLANRMKSNPMRPMLSDVGNVEIVSHAPGHFEEAVIEEVVANLKNGEKTAVLCESNEMAANVALMLMHKGVSAHLVGNSRIDMFNLCEIRFFYDSINTDGATSTVTKLQWEQATTKMCERFSTSALLPICRLLVDTVCPANTIYKSDVLQAIHETAFEDLEPQGQVVVTTIHKAKGAEFDQVFLLLTNAYTSFYEEQLRVYYVGCTRAKKNLCIHSCSKFFRQFGGNGIGVTEDQRVFKEPREIVFQLSYSDVSLGFFALRAESICTMYCGEELVIEGEYLSVLRRGVPNKVIRMSKKCLGKIEEWNKKGYRPYGARVRYMVYWWNETTSNEELIVLPDVYFKKD